MAWVQITNVLTVVKTVLAYKVKHARYRLIVHGVEANALKDKKTWFVQLYYHLRDTVASVKEEYVLKKNKSVLIMLNVLKHVIT
jgi:hypothetical protein